MVRSVRSAGRDRLIAELEDFATDRQSHGKLARAEGAREAARQLAEGAEEVTFERVTYRVGDYDRSTVQEGTREEIVAELNDASEGWSHFGKPELAFEAAAAGSEILGGADSVRVGHLQYVVRPADDQS